MTNKEVEIIKMVFQSYLNIVKIFKKPNYISEEVITEVRDKLIKELEQTMWTPVSEGLPKEFICDDGYVEPSDYVLVWGDHGNYGVSRYWGNRKTKTENPNSYNDWMDLDWVVQKPIAWMPLPQPYIESEDKE